MEVIRALLTDLISILTGGIVEMSTGIGQGLNSFVQSMILTTSGDVTEISIFGGVVAIFAAVGVAIGLGRFVLHWISSLGARN